MHIKKAPLREQWSLDGSFAVLLDGLVPWQDVVEVLWMPLDVGVRQVLEEVLEVLEGFAVVVDDLDFGGDELDLRADLLFAHGRQGRAAALADALFFRQRDEAFLMRELCQKLSCMVLLLLAVLMCRHLNARLWRISLRFNLRLVEEIYLSICGLRQDPRCPFRAGSVDHLLQLGNLGLEHLIFRL